MSGTGIELVLFDLGDVLVQFRGVTGMGELAGMADPDELWARWLTCPWVRAFETGRCAEDAFAAGMVEEWGLALTPAAFAEEFRSWLAGPMAGAEALVRQVGDRARVSCFSNTNSLHWEEHAQTWPMERLIRLFETTFLSFQMGMLKPDLDAFEYVVASLGLRPGDVLFLDDNQVNVDAARRVGFAATRVLGVQQAKKALIDTGVLGVGHPLP